LVLFHHDPTHSDADLERLVDEVIAAARPAFPVVPGREGATFTLRRQLENSIGD
jgi:hypothetical protein